MGFELTESEEMVRGLARKLARERVAPRAAAIDETEEFPHDLVQLFAEQGLMGLVIPEAYGGAGASTHAYLAVVEEIGWACAATCTTFAAQALGSYPLLLAGSEGQKRRYLPDLASGAKLAAFALTEPGAGSDVAGMQSTALRRGDHYVLNGAKQFTTSGDQAHLITVFAYTDRGQGHRGISAFLVERGFPGFRVGKKERKMGIRGSSTAALHFEDCIVPAENRLGQEGDGFKLAMQVLDRARPSVGALAVGIAQAAFDHAREYAQTRRQFGQPIASFQAIQFMLANMAMDIHHARLSVRHVAFLIDAGVPRFTKEAAMCKCFCSDMAMRVTTDAVQVFGGYGYIRDYPVERLMRDAKITQIYDGTNEIQRLVIATSILKSES